ncbi:MAG TPA: AI-2E family transporter [Vicinamibacterales bacterium]|jgi:predicted PurR-regulated permease PerM|nr:AI-2E family transporter [Vicinamibacterales bacterium]
MAEDPQPTATRGVTASTREGVEPAQEPLEPTPGAPGEPAPVVISMPVGVRNVALTVIGSLAGVFALNYAQPILIPVVLGILIAYALEPPVTALSRMKLPRPVGSAIVILVVVGGVGLGTWALTGQTMEIVSQVPQAAARVRERMQAHRAKQGGAIEAVQRAANELQKTANAASDQAQAPSTGPNVQKVQVVNPAVNVSNYLYWGGMGLIGGIGQAVVILFLVYFFLSSGNLYKKKLVKIAGPHLWQKKLTVQILDDINTQIESFIRVQVMTSAIVGVATMAALWYLGLNQFVIWGLLAGIFNSIPYMGPVIVTGGLGTVAFLQFDSVSQTLLVCGAAFVITSLEGFLLTPALMSRAARMNPVAVFVGLLFWSWIWGIWGAVLAVPMLMMLKAVCDHIDDLQPVGELLGE